jgi:hypothetical protein
VLAWLYRDSTVLNFAVGRGDCLSKQNYRQMKKQKEHARKARQVEKQQRRQMRANVPAPGTVGESMDAAQAPQDGLSRTEQKD